MDIEQTAVIIRDAIRDLPKRYENNLEEIKHLEWEEQDLLHYMEFVKLNAYKGFDSYEQVHKTRTKRRDLKNENDLLKYIVPIMKDMESQLNNLNKAIGDIRRMQDIIIPNRKYKVKVRKDLEKIINGVKK